MTQCEYRKITETKKASRKLALISAEERSRCLVKMAELFMENAEAILAANKKDAQLAEKAGLAQKRRNILTISMKDIEAMADYFKKAAGLSDITGKTIDITTKPNGLVREKKLVPLGTVAMIYEARPSVVTDSAALCMRTGNALLLKCSRNAVSTDECMVRVLKEACTQCGIPEDAINLVSETGYEITYEIVQMDKYIDLAIVRGGYQSLADIKRQATVPVIGAGPGNCHIFIDESAREDMAVSVAINSKVPRPLACNATETLLIHKNWPLDSVERLVKAFTESGITLRGCEKMAELFGLERAEESDWEQEYFAPILAVKMVDGLEAAVRHINHYRTPHTECIITENAENAAYFMENVEANVVCHNAATRLTDGIEFDMGGEMGISTQKYPCGGPIGMRHLMQEKYFLHGNGTLR